MAQNYGNNQINWGQWQSMPDYREGWKDKNKSSIVGIIRALDLTQKIPGIGEVSKTIHEGEDRVMTGLNRALAPLLKFESETVGQADPIRQTLSKVAPETHKRYQDWWNNHGADVAAIAALTYVTGGAGAKAAAGAGSGTGAATGATAAPAASGGATASGGLAGSTAAATQAISPVLASLGGGTAAPASIGSVTGGGLASAAAPGTLGAAGTSAAMNALTPAFATFGAATPSTAQGIFNAAKQGNAYRSNISKVQATDTGPTDEQRNRAMKESLAQQILKSGERKPEDQKDKKIKNMANNIMMNRFNQRGF